MNNLVSSDVKFLAGADAIAQVAIQAGCRFFTGYPMSPFTELLESFAKQLPAAGGVCVNAASEIEAISMVIGAASTGARAATGSCGKGLALMQEGIADAALSELPMLLFNMGRNQDDYFRVTRGGGWGDYRTLAMAPKDVAEAVSLTDALIYLADLYRTPVMLYADHFISANYATVEMAPHDLGELPSKNWQLDGTLSGTGRSRAITTSGGGKVNRPSGGVEAHWRSVAAKYERIATAEQRWEGAWLDDAQYVVVAFGSGGLFVERAVEELRANGVRVGCFRPITLWPFPAVALARATEEARGVFVFELNAGQMIDDVRLSVESPSRVSPIGGISVHESSLRFGSLMDVPVIIDRISKAIRSIESSS